jgi:hypothetical protein
METRLKTGKFKMLTPLTELFDWVIKPIITALVAVGVWMFKRQSSHAERIVSLEDKAVTEQRVRDIMREEVSPLREDITEIKSMVNAHNSMQTQLLAELAEERGFRRGQAEASRS